MARLDTVTTSVIFNLPSQALPSTLFVIRIYMDAAVLSYTLQIQLSHTNRITEAATEVFLPSTQTQSNDVFLDSKSSKIAGNRTDFQGTVQ